MKTLALLLLSGALAFGQAFTFNDPAFVAGFGGAASCTTNGVDTSFPGKVAWYKGSTFTNAVDGTSLDYYGGVNSNLNFVAGKVGNCLEFAGSYTLDTPTLFSTNDYDPGTNWTVEGWFWVSSTALSGAYDYYFPWQFGNIWYGPLSPISSDLTVIGINNQIVEPTVTVPTIARDTWVHLAWTYDTNQVCRIFVNGQLVGSALSITPPAGGSSGAIYLGSIAYDLWGVGQGSKIDEWTLYSRALSCDEVFTIYTLGSAGKP